ncbi:hypothetical protein ACGGZK_12715 [Agromyces sp. MMS24-K17]|uniref:hypothetical protein n=1 Tax=Agromyces sp. MMS24-K17 TaxID=3372850 RepID=UPI0037546DDB
MPRLPSVLDADDLPLPELMAARLDGEVIGLGTAWVPVDEPDLATLRAAVLAKQLPEGLIADRRSAAWVLGALVVPPTPPQACVPYSARVATRTTFAHGIREVVIGDADIVTIGSMRCTGPHRTAMDLLRDVEASDAAAVAAAAAVLALDEGLADEVHERLVAAFRLPNKALALSRLTAARRLAERLAG